MQDHVQDFTSLMMDILNISEEDKLFNFQMGLQRWVHIEVRRHGVKNLASAIAMGESLVDFKNSIIHDREKAKSWPKEKKFEKKTTKNPSWKPTGKKLREDWSKPKGKSISRQRSKSSVTLSVMDHIG